MSETGFFLLAAAAVMVAVCFAALPLLRAGEGDIGTRRLIGILALAAALPLATWLSYRVVGTPEGIAPDQGSATSIRNALIDMANAVERDPAGVDGWIRLGLAYRELEEHAAAEHAFRRALYLEPESAMIRTELAETLLYASGQPRLPLEARELLQAALAHEQDNQKALWLLGLDDFQRQRYAAAIDRWQRLAERLDPGSVRDSVREQISRARAAAAAPGNDAAGETGASSPQLQVRITIDPELAGRLAGDETLFVTASRAGGDGPPLAARRLPVSGLPVTLTLTDADAMIEGLALSDAERIVVTARTSASGRARAQSGDFHGRSGPLTVEPDMHADVVIDRVR